ncbi:MAG: biotin--[acetyl-CoA-carboxylase] ligase [Rhabdochlamydiaceae bacterium]
MKQFKDINYIHFSSIDSTNNWAKANHEQLDLKRFTCVTADEQTNGRGSKNKKWLSPKSSNLYTSLVFSLPSAFPYLTNVGQVMAYSSVQVLRKLEIPAYIKWPNDILVEGKKIEGILCELIAKDGYYVVVLGWGLNVNMSQDELDTLDQAATSLFILNPIKWDVEPLLASILDQFIDDLDILKEKGFSYFKNFYEKNLLIKESSLDLQGKKVVEIKMNDRGQLELKTEDGLIQTILNADN